METKNNTTQSEENESGFSFKYFYRRCLDEWRWFAISILIFCAAGLLIGLVQQPVYERTAEVLVKNQESGASADLSSAFSSMGLVSSSTSVNNELISFMSPAVMQQVVSRLKLEMNYTTPGRFHEQTLYGSTLPVTVTMPGLKPTERAEMRIDLRTDGSAVLSNFVRHTEEDDEISYDKDVKLAAGQTHVKTPLGMVSVVPNPRFAGKLPAPMRIDVTRTTPDGAARAYAREVSGRLHDRDADVIDLGIKDVNIERGTDILNTMIEVYNEDWVEDKNKIAIATSNFINERLMVIERELGDVDSDISEFKSENLVPDVEAASQLYLTQTVNTGNDILEVSNRLAVATYVRDYLKNPASANNVLPANIGLDNMNLEQMIDTYNRYLLERNNLLSNSSPENPVVKEYEQFLKGYRESILRAVTQMVQSLTTTLHGMQKSQNDSREQIARNPSQAKYLLSVERQQKVKESLYLFLLQKREENELTQTFTAYNIRVITPPTGSPVPVSPRRGMIMAIAFLLGVIIPAVVVFIIDSMNTSIKSRKDLAGVPVPFAGEIPFNEEEGVLPWYKRIWRRGRKKVNKDVRLVVADGLRDSTNEAFRVVRGNIEFMGKRDGKADVIVMTSFNPGSGKSYISVNLSMSFAIKGKRVLLIDGDLRRGTSSSVVGSPTKGISDYLSGRTDDWRSLLRHVPGVACYDVMPVGKTPPNPTELIDSGRMETLIEAARDSYDLILIDCPPINIVADTQIIDAMADRTIFVARAGRLDKDQVPEITALYENKRLKNMMLVLNGTRWGGSRYYSYHYHYHYYHSSYYHSSK